jgi:hypothetical protein
MAMDIPSKLNILGHDYNVDLTNDLLCTETMGVHCKDKSKIVVCADISESQQASTLLHEIIEAINSMQEIGLEHQQICQIEAGLFQVMKNNNLNFGT